MTGRWNWDFEDRPQIVRTPPPPPPETAPLTRQVHTRRRRGGAALVIVGIVVVVVGTLSSSLRRAHPPASPTPTTVRVNATHAGRSRRAPADGNRAVAAVLAYTPFVRQGADHGHDVALTFDDGPGPYTPGVLDVLERLHVPATFFAIGEMERYFSASTIREVHDGDVIGDHTETHPAMALLSAHEQHEELFEQIARIELLGGPRPRLFRPPYGSYDATTLHELKALHLLMVLWSVDTNDYLRPGVRVIVKRALAGARPGAIILMHDGGGDRSQTIAALPTIVEQLRARGFDLVTVPQLLADDPPSPGEPLPANLSGD